MATRIRLRRVGRKKLPLYRIVVADQEAPRDGRFIEIIGTYNRRAPPSPTRSRSTPTSAPVDLEGATPRIRLPVAAQAGGVFKAATADDANARHMVVGRLRKPHGLKGDLTLFPITGRPRGRFGRPGGLAGWVGRSRWRGR